MGKQGPGNPLDRWWDIVLDPEHLTFVQWFWLCFFMILAIFWACRWIDLNYQCQML